MNRGEALRALQIFVADGGYQPGDRLPAERELIDLLGMSRATLRHALAAMEHSGAIWRHVGKGTFLSEGHEEPLPDPFATLGEQLSPVKMMRARLCIEPAIAREAAINASTHALDNILKEKNRNANSADWAEYRSSDDSFHRAIAAASDNVLLEALFEKLNQVKGAVTSDNVTEDSRSPQVLQRGFAEHTRIFEAIAAHDPVAAHEAMRRHIGSVSTRLFGEA